MLLVSFFISLCLKSRACVFVCLGLDECLFNRMNGVKKEQKINNTVLPCIVENVIVIDIETGSKCRSALHFYLLNGNK